MAGKISGDDDVISDINITPFVDIILVVLIIFMVTATTGVFGIGAELPSAANTDPKPGDSIGITLRGNGELLLDGEKVNAEGLRAGLRAAKALEPEVVCLVSADKGVAWGRMVWLIDVLKSEGQTKYFFNTDRASAVGPDPALTPNNSDSESAP
jgi:biopolymer transport protein ExbD